MYWLSSGTALLNKLLSTLAREHWVYTHTFHIYKIYFQDYRTDFQCENCEPPNRRQPLNKGHWRWSQFVLYSEAPLYNHLDFALGCSINSNQSRECSVAASSLSVSTKVDVWILRSVLARIEGEMAFEATVVSNGKNTALILIINPRRLGLQ